MVRNLSRRMGKKAIFFTFIAILLVAAMVFSFSMQSRHRFKSKSLVFETRIHTMNSFVEDIDVDIQRGCFITTHRTILAMIERVTSSGEFVDDVQQKFRELFLNGTYNGSAQSLMANNTFNDWIQKTQNFGEEINIDLEITLNLTDMEIVHIDSWNLGVELDMRIEIEDISGLASWNVTKQIMTTIPISGFEDPTYIVYSSGDLINVINETPFTDYVSGNDTSNLQDHVTYQYYTESQIAPSFLMRLEGNMSASEYGIESMVNLQNLIDLGKSPKTKTAIDYLYFTNTSVTSYSIDNMPSWFYLDDEYDSNISMTHLEKYEVDGMAS